MDILVSILQSAAPQAHFIAFGLLLLAGINIPVSEDIVFIISASLAATVVPENMYKLFAGCFAGAYLSDIIAYSIGRFAGTRILQSSRLYKIKFFNKNFSRAKMIKIETYFSNYGAKTLFFGRFIPFGVRNMLFMTSGLIKMPLKKFLLVDFLALVFTSIILFKLGLIFGENYKNLFSILQQYKIIIFSVFIAIVLLLFVKHKLKQSNKYTN